ncbi:hypothetical protein DVH24_002164 [Malus domestica]|uniref:Uncharacterized protein n=1 Tax=Malus domestica TaxID=3750 RepID=A0A498I570_MALDO|nr:hypothetical protein DVH24_002164 [Malus domestica]
MAASSCAQPTQPAILDNPKPPMVRVHNKDVEAAFLVVSNHLLNGCRVWWEDIDYVSINLPPPTNPLRPCTRTHPCYLDLGFRFPFLSLWKEILTHFQIGICNLTHSSICIISCFWRLKEWYHPGLGLSEFRVFYSLWRSAKTRYFFFSIAPHFNGLLTSLISSIKTRTAQDALKPLKCSNDTSGMEKKKRKRKTEGVALTAIPAKTSKKKTRLPSNFRIYLDKAPETIYPVSLAEKTLQGVHTGSTGHSGSQILAGDSNILALDGSLIHPSISEGVSIEVPCLVVRSNVGSKQFSLDASGLRDARHAQALICSAIASADSKEIRTTEDLRKSRIIAEQDIQERNNRLEALLDTKRT